MSLMSELEDLGELMADNLVTMGVTDADASDGLTTLANKILDVPQGGSCIQISLTSNKSILSYADSETATLTATVTENGTPKDNTSVQFYKDNVAYGNPVSTDSSGIATISYPSNGVGDVSFTASVGTISSVTFVLEDCFNALLTEQSISNSSGTKISSVGLDTIYNIRNENFSLECTHKGKGVLNICRQSSWSSSSANYRATIGYADGKHYYATRTTSSNESYGDTASTSTEYEYKLTRDGSTISYYVDDVLMGTKSFSTFASYDDWSIYSIIWGNGTSTIRNIKLKPL